jgi:hypothetical protein
MGSSQSLLARKDERAQYANAMQICPADSERAGKQAKRGDAEARAGRNGMIVARMVDLPKGIGRATYHPVPVRQ